MQEALAWVVQEGVLSCTFLSDCQTLVRAYRSYQPPTNMDWRAQEQVFICWKEIKERVDFGVCYIDRNLNQDADLLAKYSRDWGWDIQGCTYPLFRLLQ